MTIESKGVFKMPNKMIKPMKFKGKNKKRNYFEGWYYKCVTLDRKTTLSFIPGISINKENPHAFIQVIYNNGESIKTNYLTFETNDFYYDYNLNRLSIKNNLFSLDGFSINFETNNFTVRGEVKLLDQKPIKTNPFMPSIMGFFEYLPFMECNHDVVSMSHKLKGKIKLDDKTIDFDNGKGYIEKDYGKSFPSKYVWIQSNNFSDELTSLMFSYAKIPYIGLKFNGFITNLHYKNKEYRFATYNLSKAKIIQLDEHLVVFEIKKGKYKLIIKAENSNTIPLAAPKEGVMDHYIKEGLSGFVEISLYEKQKLIYNDIGKSAGIEIMM